MDQEKEGFLHPEKILQQLNLPSDITAADFGCGHGFFAIPLAKAVSQGQVYALDVVKEALEAVKNKAEIENISNITTMRVNLELPGGSELTDQSIDLIVLVDIFFQLQDKTAILKEAWRVLKNQGQLILIDWLKGTALSPKEGWLISKEEARYLIEEVGLVFNKELSVDQQHYGLLFQKK